MIAAADLLARKLKGTNLTELHALADNFDRLITTNLDVFPAERQHCSESVIAALKDAFADFRQKQIEEFAGEKALICTCFGVTEDTIESAVTENSASTVSQVGQLCKAGLGCGSCQMMIQEIIDSINCVK